MEDIFLLIIKETSGTKYNALRQTAQIAYDKLNRQHGMNRDASHELRSVCFTALQMALDTKRAKFITIGLNGLHRVIKDERFYIGLEPEDDSVWLPAQLLRATHCILPNSSSEDTIVNVLRLFLSMACSPACTLNGRLLIEILTRCGECWEQGSRAIKAASLAAASQCLRTFCSFLKEEAEEVIKTAPHGLMTQTQASAVYNEVIPVMQWLCSRLIEFNINASPNKKPETNCSLYFTECILTLTSSFPRNVHANPHFTTFLWQKFCPTLAAALGSPGRINLDKKFTYKDALHMIENENRGFFTTPGLDGPQARCVYLTGIQLLRIAGSHGSLRPMLEALFHRMLLLPAPQNRIEPLKCVREIFKSPERLIDLTVILHTDKNALQGCSDEMALFRLIIDAMEECANINNPTVQIEGSLIASVECMVALLDSLKILCTGEITDIIISDQIVDVINNRHETLKDADYTGPLTYQSMTRLPAPYRDAVVELRHNVLESSSGSESDGDQQVGNDAASNASGDTEGPEDEPTSSSEDTTRFDRQWCFSAIEEPFKSVNTNVENERKHSLRFAQSIRKELVPKLLLLRSCIEVDEAIQEFASSICQESTIKKLECDIQFITINADGIYLATHSSLLLSFQLSRLGYYEHQNKDLIIPVSEQQFVSSIQNSGVIVYLSSPWLCELYQTILVHNALECLGKDEIKGSNRCALIDMLCDAGGLGSTQMMSEWQRLQTANTKYNIQDNEKRRIACKKLSRRLLTCCWNSMLTVLSSGLTDIQNKGTSKIVALSKRTLGAKANKNKGNGEALYAMCLDGLHAAAILSNNLNLQHLASKIFTFLTSNVIQSNGPRISASQALSMDVVLNGGLSLGSYSADCWPSVFTVCRHVSQLERKMFTLQHEIHTLPHGSGKRELETGEKLNLTNEKLNISCFPIDDDETCVDVYSFLQTPLKNPHTNVSSILKIYSVTNELVLLSQNDTATVLSALSHQAENLFSNAAERLSLPSLCDFLKYLCKSSRDELYKSATQQKGNRIWWPNKGWRKIESLPISLLLHRVGDVTLRVFRSSRPLLHLMKIWAIAGPHLMDAACHRDRVISKRAIEYMHDIITALLVEQSELAYFHFNEALLKPFESLLSIDSCDSDVQDQIVACLYEIVEVHRTEIHSGWKPLFGTLRNARKRLYNMTNIMDIFRVFLESDNTLVFANAGLDCILCLLSYLEVSGAASSTYNSSTVEESGFRVTDFLHEILSFLEQCSSILAFMFNMPKCPTFNSTYKIKGISYTRIIDANIPNSMENFTYFGNDYLQTINEQHMISYRSLHIEKENIILIDEMDKPSGVLKVWFILLDGLINSLIVCPSIHQSQILQTIFKLFKNLRCSPGLEFGFYCINHLLIPMIQDWLRFINKTGLPWNSIEKNFKHCCCITTDLVVEFMEKSAIEIKRQSIEKPCIDHIFHSSAELRNLSKFKFITEKNDKDDCHYNQYGSSSSSEENIFNIIDNPNKISNSATLALKQILLVLIECSAQPQEAIARVSVSCLKHLILSTGVLFNETHWMIACSAIHRACTVTIAPLRQLSFAFHEKSHSFYGDCATVKVAARRDTSLDELARIYSLGQQVFLSDNQRDPSNTFNQNNIETQLSDDRSYSFLLYPVNNGFTSNLDNFVIRIPLKSIVVGLLANQMLLQLVAKLMLSRLKCVPQTISACIFDNYSTTAITHDYDLDFRSKEILLRCVKQYLTSSIEFDSRPGLKFLMQKVANIDYAANLYKQMTSSWMIYYIALIDSYLNDIVVYNLGIEDLNFILLSCSRLNTTSVKKKENFVRYLFCLQDAWNLVCELYLSSSIMQEVVEGSSIHCLQTTHNLAIKNGSSLIHNNDSELSSFNNTKSSSDLQSHSVQIDEENLTFTTVINDIPSKIRNNPFDRQQTTESEPISPEIEQQRTTSISKDSIYKRVALSQLVIASMELLHSLPNEAEENLKLLMTPTIREAFRQVQIQAHE